MPKVLCIIQKREHVESVKVFPLEGRLSRSLSPKIGLWCKIGPRSEGIDLKVSDRKALGLKVSSTLALDLKV